MFDRLIYAHNLRVGLRTYQTGKAIAGVAANAAALVRILFVEHDPDRHVEGLQSRTREVVGQLLNARLMTDGGPRIGSVGRWFGRIFSTIAVHLIEVLSLGVIRFQIVVADRPSGRDAAVVAQLAEIFLAQPEQSSTVKLGVAADVVVGMRMKFLAILVEPRLFGVVVGVDVDGLRIPVRFLARNVVAALKDQYSLSGRRQVIGERSPTCAGSDDDHVVVIVTHDANPPLAPQKMQRLTLL